MDLVRLLLLEYEGDEAARQQIVAQYQILPDGKQLVRHHRQILLDANYVVRGAMKVTGGPTPASGGIFVGRTIDDATIRVGSLEEARNRQIELGRLSWEGHEVLDAIRNETVWNHTKEKVLKPGASWTISFLVEVAKAEIRKHLGLP